MILECPNCGTQFNVPDGAIPPEGRKVKCASCAHKWVAKPESAVTPAPAPVRRRRPAAGPPGARRPGQPRPQRPVAPERQRPQPIETPEDLQTDAALASQHQALRRQLVDDAAAQPDDGVNPMAGIADDDFAPKRTAPPPPAPSVRAEEPEDDGDMDFMARIAKGADSVGVSDDSDDDLLDDDDLLGGSGKRKLPFKMPQGVSSLAAKPAAMLSSLAPEGILVRAGWGSLVVFWLTVFSMVFVFGDSLKAMWPASSQIYAALNGVSHAERVKAEAGELSGAIVDEPEILTVGLSSLPENQTRWETRDGKNYLILTVLLRNEGRRAATVPKVKIIFLDKDNRPIGEWVEDPPGRILTRGSYLLFRVERADYPLGIAKVVTSIVDGSQSEKEGELP